MTRLAERWSILRRAPNLKARMLLAGMFLVLVTTASWVFPLPSTKPLDHDAYIWQRSWNAALVTAIESNSDLVSTWRVLAAQARPDGRLVATVINKAVLQRSQRPVVLVIRIDGQLQKFDSTRLQGDILELYRLWVAEGLPVAGIEIDFDCATSRLPEYSRFLTGLRSGLDAKARLSITALPAWLTSPALGDLLSHADESILQVHSVEHPGSGGLLDPGKARQWIVRYAEITPRVFRVALPTYGSRIGFDDYGNLAFVESETALGRGSTTSHELTVQPQAVKDLLDHMKRSAPKKLLGFSWFRLPTNSDTRAWSAATWRALVLDQPLTRQPRIEARGTPDPRLFDLVMSNPGPTDVPLPSRIPLPTTCTDADGANEYEATTIDGGLTLSRAHPSLLHPGSELPLGWTRCTHNPTGELHGQT
jgi:hypothetical protein